MNQFGIEFRDSDRRMRVHDPPPEAAGTIVDFDAILSGIRRQRWVFAGWIFALTILAIAITVTTPPSYRASATVMITDDAESGAVRDIGSASALTASDIETAEQVFRSRTLALRVVDELDLAANEVFMNRPVALAEQLIDGALAMARRGVDAVVSIFEPAAPATDLPPPTEADIAAERRQAAARLLQSRLGVNQLGRSTALGIHYTMHDPVLVAAIVDTYADAYVTDQMNAAFERGARTTEWLQQRLAELEADAREAALAVQEYRIENDLVMVRDSLVSEGNVDRFNIELTQARAEAARIRARVDAYETALAIEPQELARDDSVRLSLPGSAALDGPREMLGALRARRAEVVAEFGADHSQVAALERGIEDAARRLYAEMRRQLEVARGELEVAETQVASLQEALDPVAEINAEASRDMVELRLLEQRAESLGRLHQEFLQQFQEVGQLASFPAASVRILTGADVPRDAIAPSKKRAVLLAVILGLLVGTVHAFWREWRDRGMRTEEDVVAGLGQSFLGYLPTLGPGDRQSLRGMEKMLRGKWRKASSARRRALEQRPRATAETAGMPVVEFPLASLADPNSLYCETLRRVRNATLRADGGQSGSILGMTSLLSGEGKTHVASDLADVLSLQSGRTLLIDCDFRRLSLSQSIGIRHGLSVDDVLSGRADWHDALSRLNGTEVDVLGWDSRMRVGEPVELLGSEGIHSLIRDAASKYQKVVLDLAAIGATVDVRELLPVIDQMLLVAQWGRTSRTALQRVLATEPGMEERMIGVVLNNVNMRRLRRYAEPTASEYLKSYGT
jgi:succinoglycan biosynthesis transport protein ExoP